MVIISIPQIRKCASMKCSEVTSQVIVCAQRSLLALESEGLCSKVIVCAQKWVFVLKSECLCSTVNVCAQMWAFMLKSDSIECAASSVLHRVCCIECAVLASWLVGMCDSGVRRTRMSAKYASLTWSTAYRWWLIYVWHDSLIDMTHSLTWSTASRSSCASPAPLCKYIYTYIYVSYTCI